MCNSGWKLGKVDDKVVEFFIIDGHRFSIFNLHPLPVRIGVGIVVLLPFRERLIGANVRLCGHRGLLARFHKIKYKMLLIKKQFYGLIGNLRSETDIWIAKEQSIIEVVWSARRTYVVVIQNNELTLLTVFEEPHLYLIAPGRLKNDGRKTSNFNLTHCVENAHYLCSLLPDDAALGGDHYFCACFADDAPQKTKLRFLNRSSTFGGQSVSVHYPIDVQKDDVTFHFSSRRKTDELFVPTKISWPLTHP